MEATQTATPRHTSRQLPLLPSGPGGFHCLSLRKDRLGYQNAYTGFAQRRPAVFCGNLWMAASNAAKLNGSE